MKRALYLVTALGLLAAAGCGPRMGYIIKPVPVDERLTETVIARDRGLFVTDKIAIIDVDGLLFNQRQSSLLGSGENPVSLFVEKLDKAQADPHVRAVVLRINSPGGGVTASDIMHNRLRRFRAGRKVPVVAMIEDVGASGAYDVACAAELILAHSTSVTGSIGVLVQTVSFAGTMQKIGIDAQAVTSGPRKDMASPLKPLDKEDLAILQKMVDEYYQRFVDNVAAGRPKLTRQQVLDLADGRVYTGEQAKANGLVDDVGFMDDAIAAAKRLSGAKRVKVVIYHRPWGYRANAYSTVPETPSMPQVNLLNINVPSLLRLAEPRFMYLWTGRSSSR
ncbi:MAG TPA: signal peptide peptidase SppA [Phycisphaerae bacterium]|nr:signal peptide peptidase SppA [Phycisphaerae bacterium]